MKLNDEKREEREKGNMKGQFWTCCDVDAKVECTLKGCKCYEMMHQTPALYVSNKRNMSRLNSD